MGSPLEDIKIALKVTDANASQVVKKLESSFRGLANAATKLDTQGISKVRDRIKSFDTAGKRNIETIKGQVNALQALRGQAEIGSKQFKQLTADVNKYSQELAKAEGRNRRGGIGGRLKAAGGVAATALGAGVFGGPEGFGGALIGGVVGGVPGAVVGATAGAFVSNIRKQAGAVAETAATFNKYQIALAGVSKDQEDFNTSIDAARKFSDQFVVPLDQTISQYTKLKASVVGAGLGTKETNKAFEAMSASILATGGNTEDVNSALRATAQVFSKGKVSAEELRQQIGERLPGAFTIFADSMGISTKQLDKLLEQGKVTLDDFVGFTEELIRRYGTTAEELAKSPELAGARLQVALKKAEITFGGFFAKIGAGFQDYISGLINLAVENEEQLKNMMADFILFGQDLVNFFKEMGRVIGAVFGPIFDAVGAGIKFLRREFKELDAEGKFYRGGGTPQQFAEAKSQIRDQVNKEIGVPSFNPLVQMGAMSGSVGGTSERARQRYTELFDKRFGVGEYDESMKARRQEILDMFNFDISKLKFGSGLRTGGAVDGGSAGGSGNQIKDISEAQANAQIQQIRNRERGITLTKEMIAKERELAEAAAQALPPQKQRVKLVEIEIKEKNQLNQLEQQKLRKANTVAKAQMQLNKLLVKAKGESGLFTDEQLVAAENQIKVNELMLKFNVLVTSGKIGYEELKEKIEEAVKALNKLDKDGMERFKETFKEGIKSMGDLFGNLGRAAAQAFDGLGDKIHEFVTTGKANFKEFTASVLSDLSKIFIKSAMFNLLGSALPGLKLFSAKGNAFASNGVVPFAKGGIVNKPTMFQYADGASGSFGLMGEAGAEAIMPLKRGPSGRLGVEVTNQGSARDAMNRYTRRGATASSMTMGADAGEMTASASGPVAIDVRYNVERINSVDYVTADEFQRGMQQAAAQGASQGEQRALTTLRQNTSQRRRIGL